MRPAQLPNPRFFYFFLSSRHLRRCETGGAEIEERVQEGNAEGEKGRLMELGAD